MWNCWWRLQKSLFPVNDLVGPKGEVKFVNVEIRANGWRICRVSCCTTSRVSAKFWMFKWFWQAVFSRNWRAVQLAVVFSAVVPLQHLFAHEPAGEARARWRAAGTWPHCGHGGRWREWLWSFEGGWCWNFVVGDWSEFGGAFCSSVPTIACAAVGSWGSCFDHQFRQFQIFTWPCTRCPIHYGLPVTLLRCATECQPVHLFRHVDCAVVGLDDDFWRSVQEIDREATDGWFDLVTGVGVDFESNWWQLCSRRSFISPWPRTLLSVVELLKSRAGSTVNCWLVSRHTSTFGARWFTRLAGFTGESMMKNYLLHCICPGLIVMHTSLIFGESIVTLWRN